jgi:hypothetical protein
MSEILENKLYAVCLLDTTPYKQKVTDWGGMGNKVGVPASTS